MGIARKVWDHHSYVVAVPVRRQNLDAQRSEWGMSHLVIGEVSEFLRRMLWVGIRADAVTSQLVSSPQNIVLTNPGQTALPQGVVP